jgi:hypothetical protein
MKSELGNSNSWYGGYRVITDHRFYSGPSPLLRSLVPRELYPSTPWWTVDTEGCLRANYTQPSALVSPTMQFHCTAASRVFVYSCPSALVRRHITQTMNGSCRYWPPPRSLLPLLPDRTAHERVLLPHARIENLKSQHSFAGPGAPFCLEIGLARVGKPFRS